MSPSTMLPSRVARIVTSSLTVTAPSVMTLVDAAGDDVLVALDAEVGVGVRVRLELRVPRGGTEVEVTEPDVRLEVVRLERVVTERVVAERVVAERRGAVGGLAAVRDELRVAGRRSPSG